MKKIIFALPLFCLLTVPVSAAPPYPLDELLVRAKFVCIAEVSTFDGTNVSLKVQSELRGDLGTNSQSFKVDTAWGKPEKGKRYFVFSQGHDRWGQPKNEIKLSQGIDCQGSYCGWLMLPIQNEKDVDIVKNAYSFKFRKPEEGIGPLTLEQAKQLVEQTKFKLPLSRGAQSVAAEDPTFEDLVRQLESDNFRTRSEAAERLGNLGEVAKASVPKLIALLDDHVEADVYQLVRRCAAYALGKIGPPSQAAIPKLLKFVADPKENSDLRIASARAVVEIGHVPREGITTLTKLLDDREGRIRKSGYSSLWTLGTKAKAAVPVLLKRLKDKDPQERIGAAYALGTVGYDSIDAEQALLDSFQDPEPKVRECAVSAVEGINETYAFLFKNNVRSSAVEKKQEAMLHKIRENKDARGQFIKLLAAQLDILPHSGSSKVVRAIRMLRDMDAKEYLPNLQKRFAETEKKVHNAESHDHRLQLLHAIVDFLPKEKATPFLIKVESDPKEAPQVRFRAAIMLCSGDDKKGIEHILNTHAQKAQEQEKSFLSIEDLKNAFKNAKLFTNDTAMKSVKPLPNEEWTRMQQGLQLAQYLHTRTKRETFRRLEIAKIHVEKGEVEKLDLWLGTRNEGWELKMKKMGSVWLPYVFVMRVIK